MAVSDADFAVWIAKRGAKCVLAEGKFAYESAGAAAVGTLYFCTRSPAGAYITGDRETPANQAYRDAINQAPVISRAVSEDPLDVRAQLSVGSLVLDNKDGSLDFVLDLILDGREWRFYLGDPSWPRADFRLVLVAIGEYAAGNNGAVTVKLRDQRLLLDKAIVGDLENERPKPLVYGQCYQVPLVQKGNGSTLEFYAVQNVAGYITPGTPVIGDIYDKGTSLRSGVLWAETNANLTANAATETMTRVAHGLAVDDVVTFTGTAIFAGLSLNTQYWVITAGLTANDFRVSLTKSGAAVDITGTVFAGTTSLSRARYKDSTDVDGTVMLSSSPTGQALANVTTLSPSFVILQQTAGVLIYDLIMAWGGAPSSQVSKADLAGLDSSSSKQINLAILSRQNLVDVLDFIALSGRLFWGVDHLGVIRGGRVDTASLPQASATRAIVPDDIFADFGCENLPVRAGTINSFAGKNIQRFDYSAMSSALSVESRRLFSAEYRFAGSNTAPAGTGYSTNWQSYHLTATRVEMKAGLSSSTDVTAEADAYLAASRPHLKRITVTTDLGSFDWRLGEVVNVTNPRYGFASGRNCRLIGVSVDLTGDHVDLTLLTQVVPQYLVGSYN